MDGDDLCAPTAAVFVDDEENVALSRDLTAALRPRGVKWSSDKSCALTLTYGLDAFSNKQVEAYLYNSTLELGANGAHVDTVKTLLGKKLEADLDEDYLILDQNVQYGITALTQLGKAGKDAIAAHVKSMLR
ncbi:hypothetical protein [Deinococcus hopiensis]|uniref:Uncharacterized protein n=1 Tax=Deinococcus hopiensis KR-140 TaxID=695939 RepID=A0A1W1VN74_9DEIO|nr:hypothetical protein [Deinococcus hopiensis]SMB94680.1 hypothetical protein SAMN00790413_02482 [Deinococcus hopiensis KR-140]